MVSSLHYLLGRTVDLLIWIEAYKDGKYIFPNDEVSLQFKHLGQQAGSYDRRHELAYASSDLPSSSGVIAHHFQVLGKPRRHH